MRCTSSLAVDTGIVGPALDEASHSLDRDLAVLVAVHGVEITMKNREIRLGLVAVEVGVGVGVGLADHLL